MKIALISYWSCPCLPVGQGKNGGMSIYIRNIAQSLSKRGHTVDIFTPVHDGNDTINTLGKNINVIHISIPSYHHQVRLTAEKYVRRFSRNLISSLTERKDDYNLFYCHYYFSGLVGIELKKEFNKPIFVTFHSLSKLKEEKGSDSHQRFLLEKKVSEKANFIIVSGTDEKENLISFYKTSENKIKIIPPGVNHNLFHKRDQAESRKLLNIKPDNFIFLFVGRLEETKGINLLLDAFDKWQKNKKAKNANLYVIGESVNQKYQSLNQEKIKFIGQVPYSKLPYFYNAADVVVVPSYYESFGFVALEANSSGLPVIASDVGGLPDIIKDGVNGYLFSTRKPKDLISKMDKLYNNHILRKIMGENAIRISSQFSWEKTARKLEEYFYI